eukprot:scaffold138243_cov21-Tisochrysis_lutea.AAC.1
MSSPFQMGASSIGVVFHRFSLGHRRKDNNRQHYWKPQAVRWPCLQTLEREKRRPDTMTRVLAQVRAGPG